MPVIPKILVFAGSLRSGAFSIRTADAAMKELALQGADVTRISLSDYPLPLVDQDLEKEKGVPENAQKLARQIATHDGFLIASPEYNASIPPLLKNAIDWVSRVRRDGGRPFKPFDGKVAALCSSSDGNFAGVRGLYHLRAVLMACQVEVVTPQCSVARAAEAFDEDGQFREERLRHQMETVCRTLIERAAMMSTRVGPKGDRAMKEASSMREKLIVGLDVPSLDEAAKVVRDLEGVVSFYKIGYQLVFAGGLDFARELASGGTRVFLDMKLLDIDNTVAKGVENIVAMGVSMLTLHAYPKAMRAAVEVAKGSDLTLLAVTVLTSMDNDDLVEAGYGMDTRGLVLRRAGQALAAGMGGVVCAADEASAVRKAVGPDLAVVTPGIRPAGAAHGDQKRVMTPAQAIRAGASHLVVARPIVAALDRRAAAEAILAEMAGA